MAEVCDLALEVGSLLGAADSSVDDPRFLPVSCGVADTELVEHVADAVVALAAFAVPDDADLSRVRPSSQRGSGHIEVLRELL